MKKLLLFCFLFFFLSENTSAQGKLSVRPPDFPTPPKNENYLFFLQRSRNKNTIVYDAKLKADGTFDHSEPIDVYWRRYNGTAKGHRDELKWVEHKFAYGYDSDPDGNGGFWIELTAYDEREIHLKMDAQQRPIAIIEINGKQCRLEYIWVCADDTSSWPKVFHVDIHGTDLVSGKKQTERIVND